MSRKIIIHYCTCHFISMSLLTINFNGLIKYLIGFNAHVTCQVICQFNRDCIIYIICIYIYTHTHIDHFIEIDIQSFILLWNQIIHGDKYIHHFSFAHLVTFSYSIILYTLMNVQQYLVSKKIRLNRAWKANKSHSLSE
jgi:hypothetical protein